mgnify:FL=1
MVDIKLINNSDDELYKMIDEEFNKFAEKNNVKCNYKPFTFIAKEDNKIIGIITGHSYYKEVHIADLIVLEEYRGKKIGSQLVKVVEKYYKGKEYNNINLTTYEFQAPKFYEKCGFEIEFIRKDRENPKLSKYFLVKYLYNMNIPATQNGIVNKIFVN